MLPDSCRTAVFYLLGFLLLSLRVAEAESATWKLDPTSADWNTAANWTPVTVPNGPTDIATFSLTSNSAVDVSAETLVGSIVFTPEANAYTITAQPGAVLTIGGTGIDNQSSVVPTITEAPGPFGSSPGIVNFVDSASAGNVEIITPGGGDDSALGGATFFTDMATAGNAVLITTGAQGFGSQNGLLLFQGDSSAGASTITAEGGGHSDAAAGGIVSFSHNANAGTATMTSEGAKVLGAFGGEIAFSGNSTAAQATLIATGSSGIGGFIAFFGNSSGGNCRLELLDLGGLEMDFHHPPGVTVGSIEGNGSVFLGPNVLTVGSNNLTTTFSGVIEDGGAAGGLSKIGTGDLTLQGKNSYSGHTTVRAGSLLLDSLNGSATGDGPVIVASGTLGGTGTIAGQVVVGTGTGRGAQLAPGTMRRPIGQLLVQGDLLFGDGGNLIIQMDPQSGTADQITANGVIVSRTAKVRIQVRPGTLTLGTAFTIISNTAATRIAGTFSNLSDGGIVNVNGNSLQASYEGGDGNDLTLTVVP